eukprot:g28376.t1
MVDGGLSSQLQGISAGFPHGNVLGPTIFSYFINDLPFDIRSEVGMFTDDYTMFSTIRDSSDIEAVHVQMQQNLDNIQAWADKWQSPGRYKAHTDGKTQDSDELLIKSGDVVQLMHENGEGQ